MRYQQLSFPLFALMDATGLGNFDAQFKLFQHNLLTISSVVDTIEQSRDRLKHQEEIYYIKNLVLECQKTLSNMLDCLRKYQNNDKDRPTLKLAVDYWWFEQNGKNHIDKWRKEINERVKSIELTMNACRT